MALAPAMVLNKMYHWAPTAISTMLPQLSGRWMARKMMIRNGKSRLAGKLARIWTMGWNTRDSRGFSPIVAPIGTQMTVETATTSATLKKVIRPSQPHSAKAPHPTHRCR